MKIHLSFFTLNKTCRLKDNFFAAILIFSIIMTGITMPMVATAEEDTISISFDFSNLYVQDKDGNILFEMIKGQVTQQNTENVKYTYDDTDYGYVGIIILTEKLEITGYNYLVVTCQSLNGNICISTSNTTKDISVIAGEKIIISDGEITTKTPTTKLRWEKVETAERYALLLKRCDSGPVVTGGKPFAYMKKTSCTVPDEKGKTYQIWAQRKVKGGWRTVKTIEITISDDEVNVDSRPTTKLHWKKSKKAERYAVLEKRTSYSMGGMPFAYTKKTSYKVPDEEGKMYQIRAQRKVKGKWKTIKTIEITL